MATVQIGAISPAATYGSTAGSLTVTFNTPTSAATGQTYTAEACTGTNLSGTCFTVNRFTSGSQITGLAYTPGAAGTSYYVTVTANASTGYLASSAQVGPQADMSQVESPTITTITSGTSTTSGSLTVNFTNSGGSGVSSYTGEACTGTNLSGTCSTVQAITTGSQITGLTPGTKYYVTVNAVGSTGYASSAVSSASSTTATEQLNSPTITTVTSGTSTTSGSLTVNFTAPNNVPTGQTYTAEACTGTNLSGTCSSVQAITSGGLVIGLTPGTSYYVTVNAVASAGYLASTTTTAGTTVATEQLNPPTGVTTATVNGQTTELKVTFGAPSNAPAGQTYTVEACTGTNLSGTCSSVQTITSGEDVTGLSATKSYYVTVSAVASTGYLASSATTTTATRP
jgi:hypothetical protein